MSAGLVASRCLLGRGALLEGVVSAAALEVTITWGSIKAAYR
jgi:hypothetical protein